MHRAHGYFSNYFLVKKVRLIGHQIRYIVFFSNNYDVYSLQEQSCSLI